MKIRILILTLYNTYGEENRKRGSQPYVKVIIGKRIATLVALDTSSILGDFVEVVSVVKYK